ncbi:MAG: tetratricopeptide repeat protein, partial [Thermoanaerobaculia bacterium]
PLLSAGACLAPVLVVLASTLGCAPQAEQEPAVAPQVVEIPVTTSSEAAMAHFEAGQEALDVGRGVKANQHFEASVAEDPGFSYGYMNRANSALSAVEFRESLDAAMAQIEGKSEGERLLIEINQTFLTNDSDRGLELAETLVEHYPDSPRAWLALAGIQGTRNEHDAARESMNKALQLDPESVAAVVGLGISYLFSEPKDFKQARQYMERFIDLRPDEAKAYEGLGDVNRALKQLDAALDAYTQATDTDPTLAVAQLKKGHVNSFLDNYGEARAAYDAAVEAANPQSKATYANFRAFTHIHAGDVPAALDEMMELADSVAEMGTPEDQVKGIQIFTLTNYATAALHHGDLGEAAKLVARRNALVREVGEEVGGEDFKRLQEANALIWEGLLAARQGNFDLAVEKAEANAELLENDNNPRKMEPYHRVIGLVHLLQGDYAKAVEHYRQANLNTMYIKFHLAQALEGLGETEEARRLFKEVSEWNFNSVGFALVHEEAAARAASI